MASPRFVELIIHWEDTPSPQRLLNAEKAPGNGETQMKAPESHCILAIQFCCSMIAD